MYVSLFICLFICCHLANYNNSLFLLFVFLGQTVSTYFVIYCRTVLIRVRVKENLVWFSCCKTSKQTKRFVVKISREDQGNILTVSDGRATGIFWMSVFFRILLRFLKLVIFIFHFFVYIYFFLLLFVIWMFFFLF